MTYAMITTSSWLEVGLEVRDYLCKLIVVSYRRDRWKRRRQPVVGEHKYLSIDH